MVELVGCRGMHAERRALASLAWVLPSLGLSGRVGTGGMQRGTHSLASACVGSVVARIVCMVVGLVGRREMQ